MHDLQVELADRRSSGDLAGVERFASQVVSVLASRGLSVGSPLNEQLLNELVAAAVSNEGPRIELALSQMRRARITPAALIDGYLPAAARRMGEGWMEDVFSFGAVSLGVARLQGVVRAVSSAWTADAACKPDGGAVLVTTPKGETHTLGAMVATSRLRRAGVSVCLRLGLERREIDVLGAERGFDAVMISVSCKEGLDSAGDLVKTLRRGLGRGAPIVVGGPLLGLEGGVRDRTAADFVTDDIDSALRLCGLAEQETRASRRA